MKITDVRTFLYSVPEANVRFGPILFVRVDTDAGVSYPWRQMLRVTNVLAGKSPDSPPEAERHVAQPQIPETPVAAWPA